MNCGRRSSSIFYSQNDGNHLLEYLKYKRIESADDQRVGFNENPNEQISGDETENSYQQWCECELDKNSIHKKHTNFSIEYILSLSSENKSETKNSVSKTDFESKQQTYEWLHCTRYRPPKLQRNRRKECGTQKRRLGRNPRIPFSSEQVTLLEDKFKESPYLNNTEVIQISKKLLLSESRVKIWFQNRRARERRESQDVTSRRYRLAKSFLEKTRFLNSTNHEEKHEFSESAFKPPFINQVVD